MRFILIFAVAMMLQCVSAALVMDDTKQFFTGGASLPNTVASCPSPSLRTAAVLPEIYGVLSAWLERTWLDDNYGITNVSSAKTAVLDDYSRWPTGCGSINSNRVVTSRHVWQRLLNKIADGMCYGGPSAFLDDDGQYYIQNVNSSTALGGGSWPTIEWTEDFIEAVPSNRWAEIWPTFDDCENDEVWHKYSFAGRWNLITCLRDRCNGDFDEDYADLYLYLQDWVSPKSCLDVLKEKIGDEAYAITNRTLRTDRRFLTALENALGLCDVMQNTYNISMPDAKYIDLYHVCSQSATASSMSVWEYSPSSGLISIRPGSLTWSTTTTVRTETNSWNYSSGYIAVSYDSAESASVHATLENIPLTISASNIYEMVVAAADGVNYEVWDADEIYNIGGILGYKMVPRDHPSGAIPYDFYISIDLNGLSGNGNLVVSAIASQGHVVKYSIPEFIHYHDYQWPSRVLWRNAFVESIDLAYLPICTRWLGTPAGEDSGGYPAPGYDNIKEFASDQVTVRGGLTDEVRSTFEGKAREYINHAAAHVNSSIGGHIGIRADMIPLSKIAVFSSSVLSQASLVSSGGPAQLKTALQSITLNNGTIAVLYDNKSRSYDGHTGGPVMLAELCYEADAALTNDLPHVSSAGAEVVTDNYFRAKMHWRNCRFED